MSKNNRKQFSNSLSISKSVVKRVRRGNRPSSSAKSITWEGVQKQPSQQEIKDEYYRERKLLVSEGAFEALMDLEGVTPLQ